MLFLRFTSGDTCHLLTTSMVARLVPYMCFSAGVGCRGSNGWSPVQHRHFAHSCHSSSRASLGPTLKWLVSSTAVNTVTWLDKHEWRKIFWLANNQHSTKWLLINFLFWLSSNQKTPFWNIKPSVTREDKNINIWLLMDNCAHFK